MLCYQRGRGMTAAETFARLHAGLPQQAPGGRASTARALALVPALPAAPRALDVGCGPGRQTIELARLTGGAVTGVDVADGFLAELRRRAAAAGLADRITTVRQSMDALGFTDASFDLVWSEGAIYVIGFAAGLAAWRRLLRPGGALAVSELAWLGPPAPPAVRAFWDGAYPAMRAREEHRATIAAAGYALLGDFVLPDADWWAYYGALEPRITALRSAARSPESRAVLDETRREIDAFRTRAGSYGYVFYVMRRAG